MSNISTKVDLLKLAGAVKHKAGDGVEWVMIPIDYAGLYNGEKGVYLDLTSIPLTHARENSKDTHLVKQAIGKDKFNAMSDDEKKALPILGNTIVWGETASSPKQESKPAASTGNAPSWM